jgi:hypothetical protein
LNHLSSFDDNILRATDRAERSYSWHLEKPVSIISVKGGHDDENTFANPKELLEFFSSENCAQQKSGQRQRRRSLYLPAFLTHARQH